MANLVMNIALGKLAHYASLAGTGNAALVVIPLENTGLEADSALRDHDTVATLLAASTNEQLTIGRKVITSGVTVVVDDVNNRVDLDFPDITWTAATGNQLGALLVAFDPDTTTSTDATRIPVSKHDFVTTPDGTDLVGVVNILGFARAQG